jgi:hypothetical protein
MIESKFSEIRHIIWTVVVVDNPNCPGFTDFLAQELHECTNRYGKGTTRYCFELLVVSSQSDIENDKIIPQNKNIVARITLLNNNKKST